MRLRNCKRCGKPYQTDRPGTYLCPACHAAAKRESVLKPRTCCQCGAVFSGGPRARYCPDCRAERKRAADRRCRANGPERPIGSVDKCTICGTEYIVRSGLQRYCDGCADSAIKAIDRAAGIAYYADNRDAIKARRAELRKDRKVCVICGAVFDPGSPAVTCSDACAAELRRQRQREADRRRRNR